MPLESNHFFQFNQGNIHYLKKGNGSKFVLAFHGYGNDASMFLPFIDFAGKDFTLISINLPHHGGSTLEFKNVFHPAELETFIRHILVENNAQKCSLIGYSMGGRVCLSLLQQIPELIDSCILVASDGLVFNPFYFFATHTVIGKFLLRKFVEHPNGYLRLFKWLRKRKWLDAVRYKFIMSYIGSREQRDFLFRVWSAMRLFIPNKRKIQQLVQQHHIRLMVIMGEYDRVIPITHSMRFKKIVKNCTVIRLEKGHRIFDTETWEQITSCLNQH